MPALPLPSPSAEVVVVGGGPAGASAARLLSGWGHSVVLLAREPRRPPLGESLPPSVRKLFGLLEIQGDIDLGGFYSTTGNTVWWGAGDVRSESFAGGATGYQVVRSDFDRLLLGLAEETGADVRRDADVRAVEGLEAGGSEPVTVHYALGGDVHTVRARWLLDCSGRAGVVAKGSLRRFEDGRATVALVGTWRRKEGWALDAESHTLVESYRDGWAWSVPVSTTTRYFTAMIDPRATETEAAKNVEPIYRAELAKTRHIGPLLEGATAVDAPWACTASPYSAASFGGQGFLLVGDAGSFIDPLSSFGIKKALASAWLAAVVAHTCLEAQHMTGPAVELYHRREAQMHAAYRRLSATFSLEAGRRHTHDFWAARAEGIDEMDATAFKGEPDVAGLRGAADVVAAFEWLRRGVGFGLRVSDSLSTIHAPTVEGRSIVLEERIVAPGLDGVRFLRGVDLVSLMKLAPHRSTVPDLYESYCAECAPVILPDFLGALSVLIARGVLEEA